MEITAGIFFIRNDKKILVAHPTGHDINFWSIPKGKLDKGETEIEAAIRETWEETNVNLYGVKYHVLEHVKYTNKKKKLAPFVVLEWENEHINSDDFTFKCNNRVPEDRDWNGGKFEMDGWRYLTFKEAKKCLHYAQVMCLNEVINIINKNNAKKTEKKRQKEG